MIHLYCVQGKERGKRFAIESNQEKIIGRDPGPEGIQFLDIMASRQHIKVCAQEHCLIVTDLDSANGTRVNGKELRGSVETHPGDIVTMGNTSLVVEDPLHSTSAANEVERFTRHHRTSQRLKSQRPTQVLPIIEDESPDTNLGLLTQLLSSMPLAVIMFDNVHRIIVANNAMKEICNIEISAGQHVNAFFEQLQLRLSNPSLLQNLLLSNHEDALELDCTDGDPLFAWSQVHLELKAVYFLKKSSLGIL